MTSKNLEGIIVGFSPSKGGNYIYMVLRQIDNTYVTANLSINKVCIDTYLHKVLKEGQKVRLTDHHSDLGYARIQILEEV